MHTDWTRHEVAAIYHQPLLDLLLQAQKTPRDFHPANEVQMCRLLSIKTGGCPEDCAYCPQSARYQTGVERQGLLQRDEVLVAARRAKAEGATRFCMGAAWRQAPEGSEFRRFLGPGAAVRHWGAEADRPRATRQKMHASKQKTPGFT